MFTHKKLALLAVLITVGGLSACGDPKPEISGVDKVTVSGPAVSQYEQKRLADDGTTHRWINEVGDRVFFDVDKSIMRSEGKELLVKWVALLKQNPTDRLLIEGHSDEHGTREYNLALGDRRANAVREFLVANGVPTDRIKTVSLGKERPAVIGSNEAAWSQNRRAVGILM